MYFSFSFLSFFIGTYARLWIAWQQVFFVGWHRIRFRRDYIILTRQAGYRYCSSIVYMRFSVLFNFGVGGGGLNISISLFVMHRLLIWPRRKS